MTNAEFQKHFKEMRDSYRLIGRGDNLTVNELLYMLRMDKQIPDYNVNIITEDDKVFCIFSVKQCFVPTKSLAWYVKEIELEEDCDIEDVCLTIRIVKQPVEKAEWFGIVRWCRDDLVSALIDKGYPLTENNISKLYEICNHHWFSDHMIEAGWDFINCNIGYGDGWDQPPKEE